MEQLNTKDRHLDLETNGAAASLQQGSQPQPYQHKQVRIRSFEPKDLPAVHRTFSRGLRDAMKRIFSLDFARVIFRSHTSRVYALCALSCWIALVVNQRILTAFNFVIPTMILYTALIVFCVLFGKSAMEDYVYDMLMEDLKEIHERYMNNEGSHFWVAELNDQVAGTIALERVSHDEAEIKRIEVLPLGKDKLEDIGNALIRSTEAFCREKGYRKIHLRARNTQAVAILCPQNGFELQERKRVGILTSELKFVKHIRGGSAAGPPSPLTPQQQQHHHQGSVAARPHQP